MAEGSIGNLKVEKQKHRPFSDLVLEFNDGQTHSELTVATHEILSKLQDLVSMSDGKAKGTLNLKVSFELDSKGLVNVVSEVKTTVPKRKIAPSPMWMDRNGSLSDENPKQRNLKFIDPNAKKD